MEAIRESIRAFLAESGIPHREDPPGVFHITDYRPDGSPFVTVVSADRGWVNLASGVASRIQGNARPIAKFLDKAMNLNPERPLAKYGTTENGGFVLTANYPAHVHSEWFLSDHLMDVRNAQCEEVPRLLEEGQQLGVKFRFE